MAELSIIELIVYGLVGYTGLLGLVISAFRDLPDTKSQSTIRAIWIIPSILCMYMLASAGAQINFVETNDLVYNGTDSSLITNSTTTETITFVQPVWVSLHFMFFITMIIYFIWNILMLFTKIK